jgi:hypothetical protein
MSTTLSPVTTMAQLHIVPNRPSPATARIAVIGEVDLATAPSFATGCSACYTTTTPTCSTWTWARSRS